MNFKDSILSFTLLQKICLSIIAVYVLIGISADFIANDKPLYCVCNGRSVFPIGKSYLEKIGLFNYTTASDYLECTSRIMPWIPFHANSLDPLSNGYAGPWTKSATGIHILGTDALGKDVLAGLIHGTRYAFIIGIFATLFSLIPGVMSGMMMGYFQNHKLRINYIQAVAFFIALVLFFFELRTTAFVFSGIPFWIITFILICTLVVALIAIFKYAKFNLNTVAFPLDNIMMRCIEIFESFPKLLVLMILSIWIARPSIFSIVVLIAVIRWPLFAQISRAETIRVSNLNFTRSAENIGVHWFRILTRHIWPNIKGSLLVTALFSLSTAILLEASLSFIGLGLKLELVSWGSLLNEGRQYFPGWWLSLFPGLTIFVLILSVNWLFDDKNRAIG